MWRQRRWALQSPLPAKGDIEMLICKVLKPLVSTNRIRDFEHKHLQVVLDGSTKKVAVDAVGCVPGDWVICVGSSAAREAAGSKSYPSDLTIVGIIDHWDPEAGT